jgi:hypothetical protein
MHRFSQIFLSGVSQALMKIETVVTTSGKLVKEYQQKFSLQYVAAYLSKFFLKPVIAEAST